MIRLELDSFNRKLEDLTEEANELETQTMTEYKEHMVSHTDPLYIRIQKIVDRLSNVVRLPFVH